MFRPALLFAPERALKSIITAEHFGVNMRKRLPNEIRKKYVFAGE
jgi:hypothetical protein